MNGNRSEGWAVLVNSSGAKRRGAMHHFIALAQVKTLLQAHQDSMHRYVNIAIIYMIYAYVYVYTYIHTYTYTRIYTYTHIYTYTYTHIYPYTHIHTYTYTHMHTYTHIHTFTHI